MREEKIHVGAVDCSQEPNMNICRKHEIVGYPTLQALAGDVPKVYSGARDVSRMKEWIVSASKRQRHTKGGSARCPKGLFRDEAAAVVVPLCQAHFPAAAARHAWLVVFYDERASGARQLRETVRRAALHLGSELAGSGGGAPRAPVSRRERLKSLGKRYGLTLSLPRNGPPGTGPLAKVGGVCCDCDADRSRRFCAQSLAARGAASGSRPVAVWVQRHAGGLRLDGPLTTRGIVELVLQGLGLYTPRRASRPEGEEL